MRTISYKCDRCGKPLVSRTATKLDVGIKRGTDSMEKKSYDFCSKCFLSVKKAWSKAIVLDGAPEYNPAEGMEQQEQKPAPVEQVVKPEPVKPAAKPFIRQAAELKSEEVKPAPAAKPEPAVEAKQPKKRGRKPRPVDITEFTGRTELFMGPIKNHEKDFILKLYVEDGLTVDEIAQKVHRLAKGIKRTVSSAEKSGELDKLKAEFGKNLGADQAPVPDVPEEDTGTGASNARVGRSSYVAPANTEVIDGRKYDIGAILALHRAGWPASEVAKELDYDEDQVRIILETKA